MEPNIHNHRAILKDIAHKAMLARSLLPDFSAEVLAELGQLRAPAVAEGKLAGGFQEIRDLRSLLWASIDNDDSLDLDQLSVAEALPGDQRSINTRVRTPPRCIPPPRCSRCCLKRFPPTLPP
jgi:exoribonuclease R